MITLTVLYGVPTDAAAFDAYYAKTHVPLVQAMPELEGLEVHRVVATADGSPPPHHLIAQLRFADMASFAAAMASEEGQRAAADVANFATGGATVLIAETVFAG